MKELLLSSAAYKILDGDARGNRLSHAYMLHFPDPKNLKEALLAFALRFFGANENTSVGARILKGAYPDCKLYPAEGKKLNAEAMGEILDDCALRPVEGTKKLYVIAGFDEASALLQNKTLKTLEEPLDGVYFLLGVTSLAPVLDTVRSRVRLLEIPPFTEEQIFAALERRAHNPSNAQAAKSANGVLGVAENLASGGWFGAVAEGARELCSVNRLKDAGALCAKHAETKYKQELLSEMQRLYFAALKGEERLPLTRPALVFALEKLGGAFADLKYNANFSGLLYDFLLEVVKENDKWLKLSV